MREAFVVKVDSVSCLEQQNTLSEYSVILRLSVMNGDDIMNINQDVKCVNFNPIVNFKKQYRLLKQLEDNKAVVEIPNNVSDIIGLNNEMLENEKTFSERAKALYQRLSEDNIYITYSGLGYDLAVLKHEFSRNGLSFSPKEVIDIRQIHLEHNNNYKIKSMDDLINLFFESEVAESYKVLDISDKYMLLKEHILKTKGISEGDFYKIAFEGRTSPTLEEVPVRVFYHFNGNSIDNLYEFYFNTPLKYTKKDRHIVYTKAIYQIFKMQCERYNLTYQDCIKISNKDLVDSERKFKKVIREKEDEVAIKHCIAYVNKVNDDSDKGKLTQLRGKKLTVEEKIEIVKYFETKYNVDFKKEEVIVLNFGKKYNNMTIEEILEVDIVDKRGAKVKGDEYYIYKFLLGAKDGIPFFSNEIKEIVKNELLKLNKPIK